MHTDTPQWYDVFRKGIYFGSSYAFNEDGAIDEATGSVMHEIKQAREIKAGYFTAQPANADRNAVPYTKA